MSQNIVHIENLVKRYGEMVALDHLNLDIREGEVFGLLGPNGSGKTTAINCMLSLLKYDKGTIEIFGKPMSPDNYKVKKEIGIVLQNVAVFDELTVEENIDYFCGLYINEKKKRKHLVEEAIRFVGLEDYRKMRPKKLSGGLLRRLNIACGIAHKPRLIILDEPTVAVDPQSRNKILEGIQQLNQQGSTIIYTSHYMEEVEQICTRIAIMDHGRTIALGTKEELKQMIKTGETITIEAVILEAENLRDIQALSHVFDVHYENQILTVRCTGAKHNLIRILNYLQSQDIAFGNISDADFETVPVAVVKEENADLVFLVFLEQIQNGEDRLLAPEEMTEDQAKEKLEEKKISGIYYVGAEPTLTVASNGIEESILQSVLQSYENIRSTVRNIIRTHPEGIINGLKAMMKQQNSVQELSLGGRTIDGNVQFFYALIAMGCLYGCFIGFGSAISLQANLTALAARRCVTPAHKLKLILSELISSFLIGYVDVVILLLYLRYVLKLDFNGQMGRMLLICFMGSLIGVSMGIFVGSLGKMKEGVKVGIILGISMICSFLAGLMNNTMKDIVEKHAPLINRINPAALISDAFYCINVYDDTARYHRSLIILAVMSLVLVTASFLLIRRERYDSI